MKKIIFLIILIQISVFSTAFAKYPSIAALKRKYQEDKDFRTEIKRKFFKNSLKDNSVSIKLLARDYNPNEFDKLKKRTHTRRSKDTFIDRDGDGIQDGRHFRRTFRHYPEGHRAHHSIHRR